MPNTIITCGLAVYNRCIERLQKNACGDCGVIIITEGHVCTVYICTEIHYAAAAIFSYVSRKKKITTARDGAARPMENATIAMVRLLYTYTCLSFVVKKKYCIYYTYRIYNTMSIYYIYNNIILLLLLCFQQRLPSGKEPVRIPRWGRRGCWLYWYTVQCESRGGHDSYYNSRYG